ncbi:hypothetical protein Lal_00020128 [Lupinus albus]|nr:hypothetical protein Lal_00020128 [Lupinus albus]
MEDVEQSTYKESLLSRSRPVTLARSVPGLPRSRLCFLSRSWSGLLRSCPVMLARSYPRLLRSELWSSFGSWANLVESLSC